MIRLDTANRSLTLFLGGAQVTAPLQIVVSYSDQTSSTYLGSTQLANSNGTTAVTICSAPVASVIRDIDMVTVLNTDSASQVVTIQLLDTATTYKIITVTLLVGDKLTYTHGSAWQVVNNAGNIKYSVLSTSGVDSFSGGSTGLTPATATTGAVTLGGTLAVASGGTGTATPALVAGTNVTITGTWPNQTINSSNTGGTVTSVAALTLGTTGTDVSSTVANSTTTPVITLNLPTASATNRGALSAADWTTFNSKGSGTVTSVTGTAPVVSSGGTTPAISMAAATTSTNGYLTSTDWNTFNGKGSGTVTSVSGTTGRITSTGGTTPVLDLTSGIATPGTTGSASLIPVVTIDTYGRVTSITTAANPQGTVTSVTGTAPISSSGGATPAISLDASYGDTQNPYASKTANYVLAAPNGAAGVPTFRAIVAADVPTLNQNTTGNAATATSATTATNIAGGANLQIPYNTGSGATSFITAPTITSTYLQYNGTGFVWAASAGIGTVTSVAATVPSFLSISGSPITTAGTLAISYSGTALPIANGGTGQTTASAAFNALSPVTTTGDLIIGNGTNSATRLGIGANTYVLTSNGTTATWAAASGGTPTSIVNGTSNVSIATSGGAVTVATNGATAITVDTSQNTTFNSTGALTVPKGTTAQQPTATTGMVRYNTSTSLFEGYNGTYWIPLLQGYSIDYLVVGGGGGGGANVGGGGGAGGFRTATAIAVTLGTAYTVTVGAGGAGGVVSVNGTAGSDSTFNSTTSTGGGYGAYYGNVGGNGGSGGGGGSFNGGTRAGGSGNTPSTSPSQGNNGGTGDNGSGSQNAGGGGGGASAVGATSTSATGVGGAGGAGTANSYSGSSVTYAGGGGAGGSVSGGAGGSGGGGAGATATTPAAVAGTANTGGGGGGGSTSVTVNGAAGGSGVVIIRYVGGQKASGGTVTSSGGYTIHTFTSSGTFTT